MSFVIATIENVDITLNNGVITYTAKAAIDSDGSGGNPHHDPDFQNDTSLHYNGQALNAENVPYIVVPPAILIGVAKVVLGCQAQVSYKNKTCAAVVGDIGPHNKLGEISIACAVALGIPPSPNTGGVSGHVVKYVLQPGVPAQVNGVTYNLQPYR